MLIAADVKITKYIQKIGSPIMWFWRFMARYGLYFYLLIFVGVFYFISEKHRLFMILIPVFSTLAVALIDQYLIKRARPNVTKTNFELWLSTYSFPSAHAAMSFAFATSFSFLFLSSWLPYKELIAVGFFVIAFLIAVSRVVVGVHYAFDVFIGALLGIFISVILSVI